MVLDNLRNVSILKQREKPTALTDAEVAEREKRIRLNPEFYDPSWKPERPVKLESPKVPEKPPPLKEPEKSWLEKGAPKIAGIAEKIARNMASGAMKKLFPDRSKK